MRRSIPPPLETGGRRYLTYTYPLGKFSVELLLPRDLTEQEATRLSEFLHSLALPDAPAPTGGDEWCS